MGMNRTLRIASSYAAGILLGTAVFGGVTLATSGVQSLTAHFANIAIRVNGKVIKTSAEPFIYKGNVYVPISTVGHGLNAQVSWRGASHQVWISDSNVPLQGTGTLNYYDLPVYSGTHYVQYQGATYLSPFALATMTNEPYWLDKKSDTIYIGAGRSSGMPLQAFYDVRDYGDYADVINGQVGPTYGWTNGAPRIDHVTYPNANSLVWASQARNSQVPGVEYNLNGKYTSLTGAFGLDDASAGKAQAQLIVLGDGKILYQSPFMKVGQAATSVAVNVSGVQLLTVEFAVTTKNTYSVGQIVPNGLGLNVDFADVNIR